MAKKTQSAAERKKALELQRIQEVTTSIHKKHPFIRGADLDGLRETILANVMPIEQALDFDPNIVGFWKMKGKNLKPVDGVYAHAVTDKIVSKVVGVYNKYAKIQGWKCNYELSDVMNAEVKVFYTGELDGVNYLGLVFRDGGKCRYILDDGKDVNRTVKKAAKKSRGYTTSQRSIANRPDMQINRAGIEIKLNKAGLE